MSSGVGVDPLRILMWKVLRVIFANDSYNVILVHKYPRYKDYDFEIDEENALRIMWVLEAIEINFIDYYVVSGTEIFSMRSRIRQWK